MEEIKRIDIKEFREQGFLQELNRQFLHPMGMALDISIDDDGNETLEGIWDYRDDPEGLIFDIANSDEDRIKRFQDNEEKVAKHIDKMIASRIESLGFGVEMIPQKKNQLIDSEGLIEFDKSLDQPEKIVENFNKIKFPIFDVDGKECRLMDENKQMYILLHIEKDTTIAFSKSLHKSEYRLIDNRIVEIEKNN